MALKPSLREVLTRLQAEGVLPVGAEDQARAVLASRQETTAGMPWFVRILAGFGAWMSALFLMAFLSLGVVVGGDVGAIVLGLLLCGGTTFLRRRGGSNVFLTQLALATGRAGQGLVIGGVGALDKSVEAAAATTVVLQAVLLFVYPDAIQRFLSTLFASLALLLLLRLTAPGVLVELTLVGLTVLAHLLFLHQGRLQSGRWGEVVGPAAFGLVTTLLFVLLLRTWLPELLEGLRREGGTELPPAVLTLGLATVTLYTAWHVLRESGVEVGGAAGLTVLASLVLVALLTLQTPGIIAAAGVLALGFHRRSVVLLGMAVIFLLTFGLGYYYNLQLTLLAKSLVLLGSGLVLLGLRLFILRRFPAAEEVR
jgi:hypothetical protein